MTLSPAQDLTVIENQARSLLASGQIQEAEICVRPVLAKGSAPIRLWRLMIAILKQQRRFREMGQIQSMLVDASPGDLSLRFDLAETMLMLGEFQRGWHEYHYRYSLPHTVRIERKVQMPRWDGRPIPGKTLLIHDEQGYGDTFQFLRMISWAKQKSGAKIVLEIDPLTLSFAKRMQGIDVIIPLGTLPPPFDVHCELMSLPMALNLKMSDLPGKIPYLSANPDHIQRWRKRLNELPRPLVALVWAGRPTPDPNRSLPLASLAPLALEGLTYLSLQIGPKAVEAKSAPDGMKLIDLSQEIMGFDDTAAILQLVDLLISIDSAPVHLAGAMARPTWVMLQHIADWRWFLEGENSPWYPSLRLFRQTKQGEWGSVAASIAAELSVWRSKLG